MTLDPALNPALDPALDARVIESLRQLNQDGEPDVLAEVLGLFLAEASARLAAITVAALAGDGPALQRSAHALKGAAGTIGASALQAACGDLEEMGRLGERAPSAEALEAVRRECIRVQQVIGDLLR